jgi:hypothetical protein
VSCRGGLLDLVILYLSGVSMSYAQGGPPMLTDDPGTPGAGVWEINSALLEDRTTTGRTRSVPHIDINYGWGERIQLKYETGYLFADGPGSAGLQSDWDDSLFGLKWRFLDQEPAGADLSFYPQLELQNSHRAVVCGLAEGGPNLFLPIEVAHAFGAFTLVGEIGYQYSSSEENEWVAGLLGSLEVSKSLELLAELRSRNPGFSGDGDVILNVGLRQALGAHLKLLASAGTGLRSGSDTTRFIGYLGIQTLFGDKP